ncbi:hypothetical protein EZL74_11255 [Flavobacterium silvisoli]|uniref:DUF6671 domain-containing protein n=1 Tax=Flavobacterium silvisoli TaxID=2529433 RepID=A0A4Q9YRK2_9FLAO|nr:DUF6671 family protein [Flavobacterium silvisoli]TBX66157.1 hypothetical protein EZL74_11255 [Flavobacterium silvisoli]
MFDQRRLLIATKHGKEQVIAPLLEKALGVSCFVSAEFDTDTLGTFSGEIPRKDDVLTTLRNKCLFALEKTDGDLVIASEGSFGPHPSVFFAHADDEWLLLMDTKNNLEIKVREISLETNFNAATLACETELLDFAVKVGFPNHGLILRPSENNFANLTKGITDKATLIHHFRLLKQMHDSVYVETDMRAQYNPTRMRVIAKAAQKLLEAVQSLCPQCSTPGFVVTDIKTGLPCEWCKSPTNSTLSHLYVCQKCAFKNEVHHPHQKQYEDPMYCHCCNP